MARQRMVRPISVDEGPHPVYHFHIGPWTRRRNPPEDPRWRPPPQAPTAPAIIFTVPLTVTHVGSTQREHVEALLHRVNHILLAAGVQLELEGMFTWDQDLDLEQLPNGEWVCPFGEDIDHRVACLHLGLVAELGGLDALPFSCGRCLMVPDQTTQPDHRATAAGLAALLGLSASPSLSPEMLMSARGEGCRLSGPECDKLRIHASHFLGHHPMHARRLAVPVWAYQVCSPAQFASQGDMHAVLAEAGTIWEQADLQLQMHAWCHLHSSDLDAAAWQAVLQRGPVACSGRLRPLVAHDPHGLHIIFVHAAEAVFDVGVERSSRLLVVRDQAPMRSLARGVGQLLGLPYVAQPEQLMCPDGDGTLLTAHEVELARAGEVELMYGPSSPR